MILACHQPNFFPWPSFFTKVDFADVFIVLNNVQFARNQYQNRFNFEGKWMTMSVNRGELGNLISQKHYVNPINDWNSIKSGVRYDWLDYFDHFISESLCFTNNSIIREIAKLLDIDTNISEDTYTPHLNASEKLVDLCLSFGAETYLSGPSGLKYLDLNLFSENDIQVKFVNETGESARYGKSFSNILHLLNDKF